MSDITLANISALLLTIQSEGKAHATVIKCYTLLHSLFKMAYMADAIPKTKWNAQSLVKTRHRPPLRHVVLMSYGICCNAWSRGL